MDLFEATPVEGVDCKVTGATSYEATANSDVVIVTAGIARKPGMSRDDLIATNTGIVKSVAENVAKHSPNCVMIVVSNPLDAMVYVAWKASGLPAKRVLGQAGVLDTARYRSFLAMEIGCSVEDVQALLLGGHGDDMVPLPRYTFARGHSDHAACEKGGDLDAIVDRARKGGAEIVGLLKTGSAYYAPGVRDRADGRSGHQGQEANLPAAVYCDKEYGVGGVLRRRAVRHRNRWRRTNHRNRNGRLGTQNVPKQRRSRERTGGCGKDLSLMRGVIARESVMTSAVPVKRNRQLAPRAFGALLVLSVFSLMPGCFRPPEIIAPELRKPIDRGVIERPASLDIERFIANLTAPTAIAFDPQKNALLIAESGIDSGEPTIHRVRPQHPRVVRRFIPRGKVLGPVPPKPVPNVRADRRDDCARRRRLRFAPGRK